MEIGSANFYLLKKNANLKHFKYDLILNSGKYLKFPMENFIENLYIIIKQLSINSIIRCKEGVFLKA